MAPSSPQNAGPGSWFRPLLTILLLGLSVWWLTLVALRLGLEPQTDDAGNVVLDEFQRTKDILLVVLPLTTTALGYWFGAQGKTEAEAKAVEAEKEATQANAALTAVVDSSSEPQLLKQARENYPQAFEKR